tara:strand:- start:701 stop:1351 length:651 start_codon:yes stop_codon:yes gene_type:complete
MDKKGQFYIITVLIASLVIYSLVADVNDIVEPVLFSDFDRLSENYLNEAPKVVNYRLGLEEVDPGDLDIFTQDYIEFAQQKNPTIGLFYVYRTVDYGAGESKIGIKNYYDSSLGVYGEKDEKILSAAEDSLQEVSIDVGGSDFFFQFPVKIRNFGDGFYSSEIDDEDTIEIDVGGIIHTINYPPAGVGGPSFYAVVKSEEGGIAEVTRTGTDEFIP